MNNKKRRLQEMDKAFTDLSNSYSKLRKEFLKSEYNAKSKYCYIISAGHSGVDENGNYLTAPNKMHDHNKGSFHNGTKFYEGVFNRVIADGLCKKLKKAGIVYKKLYEPVLDMTLQYKKDKVNHIHTNVQKCILIDLHSNAFDGNARGFRVYTSKGQTISDKIATNLWHEVQKFSDKYGFKMGVQSYLDNDNDFEEQLYMLRMTACPAILPECLFFDNYEDAKILMREDFQQDYIQALFNNILWCEKNVQI